MLEYQVFLCKEDFQLERKEKEQAYAKISDLEQELRIVHRQVCICFKKDSQQIPYVAFFTCLTTPSVNISYLHFCSYIQLEVIQGKHMTDIAARRQAALQYYRNEYQKNHPDYKVMTFSVHSFQKLPFSRHPEMSHTKVSTIAACKMLKSQCPPGELSPEELSSHK